MITLFAASDYQYFYDHGLAFAKSGNNAGHRCLIYIFPDIQKNFEEQSKSLILYLTNEFYTKVDTSMTEVRIIPRTVMEVFEDNCEVIDRKALFASIRFMMLYDTLIAEDKLTGNSLLVLDIDSVINKKVKIPKKYNAGIYLRENENLGSNEYERMGMKVAAGALYVTMDSIQFVEKFSRRLMTCQKRWFCDQFVLYVLYKEFQDSLNFLHFDSKFLDWRFQNKNAIIFTGKGPRKGSPEYLKLKKELSE